MALLEHQFASVYQFRIDLTGVKPPVWRRVQVPGNYSFKALHVAIQNLMDWLVYAGSSYEFHVQNPSTGLAEGIGCSCYGRARFYGIDEPEFRISDYFSADNPRANYTCAHESRWDFAVRLEKILPADPLELYPICIAGKRAAPPEDCGGASAYQQIQAHGAEHRSTAPDGELSSGEDSLEENRDPEHFDCDSVFFTSGSGDPDPHLPDDLPERIMRLLTEH